MWNPFKKKDVVPAADPCGMAHQNLQDLLLDLLDAAQELDRKDEIISSLHNEIIRPERVGSTNEAAEICRFNAAKHSEITDVVSEKHDLEYLKSQTTAKLLRSIKLPGVWIKVGDKAIAKYSLYNIILVADWKDDILGVYTKNHNGYLWWRNDYNVKKYMVDSW